MGSNSNDSWGCPIRSKFPIFKEEIDAPLRPSTLARAISEVATAVKPDGQLLKSGIKNIQGFVCGS
jgi:hypothetical protein